MKLKLKENKLAHQFIFIILPVFLTFIVALCCLLGYQYYIGSKFLNQDAHLKEKEALSQQIDLSVNEALFDARGYLIFNRPEMRENAELQASRLTKLLSDFDQLADTPEDQYFVSNTSNFINHFFGITLPNRFRVYENEGLEAIVKANDEEKTTEEITRIREIISNYHVSMEEQVAENFDSTSKTIMISQIVFVVFLIVMLIVVVFLSRMLLQRVVNPLNGLANTAVDVSKGESYSPPLDTIKRKDEIGILTRSFDHMVKNLQLKEEELTTQNEELIAQQDELHASQDELQHALEQMKTREKELQSWNSFVNGLSNSLNKQEVMNSIVHSLGDVLQADKGFIISIANEKVEFASTGISEENVKQAISHINEGIFLRASELKRPYIVTRKTVIEEKGYHEEDCYIHDIIIPVLSNEEELLAMLMFSRFAKPFSQQDEIICESMAKQVAITLDKLSIYEEAESDRKLTQDTLNSIHEGVQLLSDDGVMLKVNRNFCEMIHCSNPSDIIGNTFHTWYDHIGNKVENREELFNFYKQVLSSEKNRDNTYVYNINDSYQPVVMKVYSEEVYRDGKRIGIIFVHRNITKEYEVDQMKSEFVSTVSHELRTPLASVLGFTELMLTKQLKEERQKKYLTTIYEEAKRLTSLINDFLDVQKMETGKQTYEKKYEDVVSIIETCIETQQINSSIHTFKIIEQAGSTIVLGDRDRLSQVFSNLISNAVKYSPNGGEIVITVYNTQKSLCVSVKDEGLGIPFEAQEHLFKKFYRVANSDTRKIGGTGLGLAIVKEIIQAHNGHIAFASEVGKGSTFTVQLPIADNQDVFTNDEMDESITNETANVVIVEDDKNLALLLEEELKENGLAVKHYYDGTSALVAIEQNQPDAIVLDIMLDEGKMDGWQFLEKVKKSSVLKDIPIVISSALEEKEKGSKLGAQGYLIKPYQPSKLTNVILQLLLQKDRSGKIMIPKNK